MIHSHVDPYGKRPDFESAAALYAADPDWYTLDNKQNSETDVGRVWVGNWGGNGAAVFAAGKKGLAGQMQEVAHAPGPSGYVTGNPVFCGVWIKVSTATDGTVAQGFARNEAPGIARAPFASFEITVAGPVVTARLCILDSGPPQTQFYGASFGITAGWHYFWLEYRPATKTWALYIDNTASGTVTVLSHTDASWMFWLAVQDMPGEPAFTNLPHLYDEWAVWPNLLATQAFRDLMWNEGAGLSWAEFEEMALAA